MTESDRASALQSAEEAVNNRFQRPKSRRGATNGASPPQKPVIRRASQLPKFCGIDTGQPWFNLLMGEIGGLPRGRVVNIWGPFNSGKTRFALRSTAAVQKARRIALWIESEGKLDPDYAAACGVNTDELFIVNASGHKAFQVVQGFAEELAKRNLVIDLIVIDSVTALPTTMARGALPTMLNAGLPVMLDVIKEHEACLLIISQERAIPDGDDVRFVGTGGFGLEHDSTVIVEFAILQQFDGPAGELPLGHLVQATLVKFHAPGVICSAKFALPRLGVSGKELEVMVQAASIGQPEQAGNGSAERNGQITQVNGADPELTMELASAPTS